MKRFWTPLAWLDGRWQREVLLQVGSDGHWREITPNVPAPEGAERIQGPVLPSLVNAHSHAFQRAFAGLAEQRDSEADDFWSWRDRMYGVALRLTPAQMRAVAAQLYVELLRGGYTQTCEFHYLHHDADGKRYGSPQAAGIPPLPPEGVESTWGGPALTHDDELAMSWSLATAAAEAGMGLTVLPVLYAHAGFAQPDLRPDQRRFATDADWVLNAARRINAAGLPLINAGVALHSLRAAHAADIRRLQSEIGDADLPIHIHIAEQQQEVRDCLAATGKRPMQYLCDEFSPDARWQLVHATHSTPAEIEQVARSGAGIVLSPGTEANLGDGACDLPGWLAAGVPISLGSDSQVTRSWREEIRWLEYGQRLTLQRRNVAAAPGREPSTAARLFEAARSGSARPAGFASWGLSVGARADFLVLDTAVPGLLGLPERALLDALVFASEGEALKAVYVAGQIRVHQGRHLDQDALAARFAAAMQQLWAE